MLGADRAEPAAGPAPERSIRLLWLLQRSAVASNESDRIEAARHQHLAAELAREVRLALEQRDLSARAREQVAERRTGRPRTDDREVHVLLRSASWYVRANTSPEDEPCRSIR